MTGFYVYDPALRDFAELLRQSQQDTQEAAQYAQRQLAIARPTIGSGVFSYLAWHHRGVQAAVENAFTRLATLLEASAQGMTATVSYYTQTDADLAAKIDATFPHVQRGTTPDYPPAEPYPGMLQLADPTTNLTLPSEPDFTNPLAPLQAARSVLSESGWAYRALTQILGFDPLEKAVEFFTGDWEHYGRVCEGWNNLANFTGDVVDNLQSGLGLLNKFWGGNAEDAAWSYFTGMTGALIPVQLALGELRHYYQQAALVSYVASENIASEIEAMVDLIIATVVTAAVTFTAAAEAGLDPAADLGTIFADGADLEATISGREFIGHLTEILALLRFFAAAGEEAVSALEAPASYPLPGHGYHFP
jgi:hypothetical protein